MPPLPPGSAGPAPIKLPAVSCHEKKRLCLGTPLPGNEACSEIYLQQPLDEGCLTHQTRQKCFFVCSSLFCPSITSLVKADKPVSRAQMRSGRRSADRCSGSPKTQLWKEREPRRALFQGLQCRGREEAPRGEVQGGLQREGARQGLGGRNSEQSPCPSCGRAAAFKSDSQRQKINVSPPPPTPGTSSGSQMHRILLWGSEPRATQALPVGLGGLGSVGSCPAQPRMSSLAALVLRRLLSGT